MIESKDDIFHTGSPDPYWNESAWFSLCVPEKNINGFIYIWHRTGMGFTVGGLSLWDDHGENPWDCLYYDLGETHPLRPGTQMYDFSVANGLTVKLIEPLHAYSIRYQGDGCDADLHWQSVRAPNDTGLPSGTDEWGSHHYEQMGRIKGRIKLGHQVVDVDCWSNRDHSWGPRHYKRNPRGDFPWAIADQDHAFQVLAISDLSPQTDPIHGSVERLVGGWYLKSGILSAVVSGTREVTQRGEGGRPLKVKIAAVDALGRELRAEGECRNWLHFLGHAYCFWWWCLTEWSFDGLTGFGDVMDYYPTQQGRRFVRSNRHGSAK